MFPELGSLMSFDSLCHRDHQQPQEREEMCPRSHKYNSRVEFEPKAVAACLEVGQWALVNLGAPQGWNGQDQPWSAV